MKEILLQVLNFISINGKFLWLWKIGVVLLSTLLISIVSQFLLVKLHKKFRQKKGVLLSKFTLAAKKPVKFVIWASGIILAIQITAQKENIKAFKVIDPVIRNIAIVIAVTWFGFRFIEQIEKSIIANKRRKNEHFDRTTADAVMKLMRAIIVIIALLVLLQNLGFSISGVLAFGGVSGIAIGFAAKDLLSNFFGAIVVYLDKPFEIGDWIRSPDKEIEGVVERIGWRETCLRTFDMRPIYVPNSLFSNIIVENPSRMTHRRIQETISIRYEDIDKAEDITKEVKEMLDGHKDIDSHQTLMTGINKIDSYSINFFIYCFTYTTNWVKYSDIKQDILLKITKIIDKHNAKLALPTSVVKLKNEEKQQPFEVTKKDKE